MTQPNGPTTATQPTNIRTKQEHRDKLEAARKEAYDALMLAADLVRIVLDLENE